MTHPMPPTLFFAGTDTDVGKTYVAALVAASLYRAGHRVGVYKPAASGCRDEAGVRIADDAVALWNAAGKPRTIDDVCPQKFLAPLAPPPAAVAEGTIVDAELLRHGADVWMLDSDVVIVEGAGGMFSPLSDGVLNIDLIKQFARPRVIIVAADRLGVIHQTLATIHASRFQGVEPVGVILCDPVGNADRSTQTNAQQIAAYTDVPVIERVDHLADSLSSSATKFIDALFMQ